MASPGPSRGYSPARKVFGAQRCTPPTIAQLSRRADSESACGHSLVATLQEQVSRLQKQLDEAQAEAREASGRYHGLLVKQRRASDFLFSAQLRSVEALGRGCENALRRGCLYKWLRWSTLRRAKGTPSAHCPCCVVHGWGGEIDLRKEDPPPSLPTPSTGPLAPSRSVSGMSCVTSCDLYGPRGTSPSASTAFSEVSVDVLEASTLAQYQLMRQGERMRLLRNSSSFYSVHTRHL
eukprot:Sspe_Gene.50995::Locus_28329_Transcript_1_1_Confidence_1.000_Length_1031::g.50995::m.50995